MFFLIAGLLCSAMVSIVLKISSRWSYDRFGMLTVNYFACLIPFLISQTGHPLPAMDRDLGICIIFALVNGVLYLAGMIMNQVNVKRNGAILQSAFARLGVMVPTCLSIALFGERPSLQQGIGIAMVLAAFCIMNIPKERKTGNAPAAEPAFGLLLQGLLFGGIADSMLKVYEEFGMQNLDDWFMGLTFISASAMCLIAVLIGKGRIGKTEIVIGMLLGIPNYLSSLLLLKSLSSISAYIAYPTYSVGAILAVTAVSSIVFKERLSKWSKLSIILIIPAILLLNL